MKAGLVAAIGAVDAIRSAGVRLRGDLLVAAVQGEEDGGLGTYSLLQRGWRADACVIPEPTGLDLVPGNAGALTFRLKVHGHATHASRRTEGVSAVEKFCRPALQHPHFGAIMVLRNLASRMPNCYTNQVVAGHCSGSPPTTGPAGFRTGFATESLH